MNGLDKTDVAGEVLAFARCGPDLPELREVQRFSMLGLEPLRALYRAAQLSEGPILEIGPYMGGSTIAMALGLRGGRSGRKVYSVELGGAYLDHPTLPSPEIEADLRKNMATFGVSGAVDLFVGLSWDLSLRRRVLAGLGGEDVGLVFVDADGGLARDLSYWAPFLRPDCFLILDDYLPEDREGKGPMIVEFVDRMVREGTFEQYDILSSTWIGRLAGEAAREKVAREWRPFLHESGHGYRVLLSTAERPDDLHAQRSRARLFEDGRELGPPHSLASEIFEQGAGRFLLWTGETNGNARARPYGSYLSSLYFSASDNSDPNTNGRAYVLKMSGQSVVLETRA